MDDRKDEHEPVLVRCTLEVPKRLAKDVGSLGLAFGCGGARAKQSRRGDVQIEAVVDIATVAEIVGKGVPVLVTERVPIAPIPPNELTRDLDAWIAQISKPSATKGRKKR